MIRTVNPARRELRVAPHAGHASAFKALQWLHVAWPDGRRLRCKVDNLRAASAEFVVQLSAGVPRETVASMKRARVQMTREALPEFQDWHLAELEGMQAATADGAALGRVLEVIEAPGNDVLVIEDEQGRRLLLPLIEQVVLGVDRESRVLSLGDIAPYVVVEGEGEDEAPQA